MLTTPSSPRWLDIVRHRAPRVRVPYLLIVQHHAVPAATRLAAPVTLPVPGDVEVLSPRIMVGAQEHRVRLLDLGAIPLALLGEFVVSADAYHDDIRRALDVILSGYPVGLPH